MITVIESPLLVDWPPAISKYAEARILIVLDRLVRRHLSLDRSRLAGAGRSHRPHEAAELAGGLDARTNYIYSFDVPRLRPQDGVAAAGAAGAMQFNAMEWVRVRFTSQVRGDDPPLEGDNVRGSRASALFEWHARLYIVEDQGKFKRTTGANQEQIKTMLVSNTNQLLATRTIPRPKEGIRSVRRGDVDD